MDTIPQNNQKVEEIKAPQYEKVQMESALACLETQVDLEGSAHYSGAIQRKRVIQTAMDLMRYVLLYSLSDLSLRMVAAWGTAMGWGSVSKSDVRKRLRQCQGWLGVLIVKVLLKGKLEQPNKTGLRLRLFDASSISQPGSHKIDWRLHLCFDPGAMRIDSVQLTDGSGGERLTRWEFQANEVVLADRAYGVPNSLGVLLGACAFFVIRIGWQNLPVQDGEGRPFVISDWLRVQSSDPAATPAQARVWVKTPQGRYPIRLAARAIPPEKAEKLRQNLRKEAKRKKHRVDERSLLAAGFVMVVSNLPDTTWSAMDLLALYRFRWQIELVFKRIKGLLTFDHLRATDPQLAQVYLLSKILIALLLGEAQWHLALASIDSYSDPQRPISFWRLNQLLLVALRQAVCGSLTFDLIVQHWPQLARYLCDDPRRRKSQLAVFHQLEMVHGF